LPPQKVDMTQYDMTDWPSWALERVANGEAVHIVKAAIENAG